MLAVSLACCSGMLDPYARHRVGSSSADRDWARRQQAEQQRREQREADEREREARAAEANEAALRETLERQREAEDAAKRWGFASVDFASGIVGAIELVRAGRIDIRAAGKRALEIKDADACLVAVQVLDQDNVMFSCDSRDITVWLRGHKRVGSTMTWINGAPITTSDFGFFAIKGTRNYRTVLGASRQAIVVEVAF